MPIALVAQTTPPEPGLPSPASAASTVSPTAVDSGTTAEVTPSFYGTSGPTATSSLGLPGFAGVVPGGVQSFLENPLRWGPFMAHPHLSYGFTYADGVLLSPGQPTTTALHTVSPGLTVKSRHLLVDYTPSLGYFSKGPYDDTVNHSASLHSGFGYGDWVFGIDHQFLHTSNPLIETATQTTVISHSTGLEASWNYTDKIFFTFTLSQQIQNTDDFQSYRQWSTMDWVNYRLTEAFSIGAGVGGGYVDVDRGSNMSYELIQGRLNWHPSARLSVNLNGGIEIRQFRDIPDSGNLINPLYGASISYKIFEPTTISLYANRSVSSSFFENEVVEGTTIGGAIGQRLLKHFNLSVSAGFKNSDYEQTFAVPDQAFSNTREEDYSFVSVGLGVTFLKKAHASIGYQHAKNESTLEGYSFESDQFSFQVGYRF